MAEDTAPDLNQIYLKQSVFLECLISNGERVHTVLPHQVSGFRQKECRFYPFANLESKSLGFDFHYHSIALDEAEEPLPVEGKFRIFISFEINNLPELFHYDERFEREIPNEIVTTSLIGVAYSTARGMILSKIADTVMAGLALPLRSARQLMEEAQPTDDEVRALRAEALAALGEKESGTEGNNISKKRKRASPKN